MAEKGIIEKICAEEFEFEGEAFFGDELEEAVTEDFSEGGFSFRSAAEEAFAGTGGGPLGVVETGDISGD